MDLGSSALLVVLDDSCVSVVDRVLLDLRISELVLVSLHLGFGLDQLVFSDFSGLGHELVLGNLGVVVPELVLLGFRVQVPGFIQFNVCASDLLLVFLQLGLLVPDLLQGNHEGLELFLVVLNRDVRQLLRGEVVHLDAVELFNILV